MNRVLCSLPFQNLRKCWHFEWLDEDIERIQPDFAPIQELDLPQPVELQGSAASDLPRPVELQSSAASDGFAAEVKAELKKLNKQTRQLVELKKQANFMAGIFYCCALALGLAYLMIISR